MKLTNFDNVKVGNIVYTKDIFDQYSVVKIEMIENGKLWGHFNNEELFELPKTLQEFENIKKHNRIMFTEVDYKGKGEIVPIVERGILFFDNNINSNSWENLFKIAEIQGQNEFNKMPENVTYKYLGELDSPGDCIEEGVPEEIVKRQFRGKCNVFKVSNGTYVFCSDFTANAILESGKCQPRLHDNDYYGDPWDAVDF